MKAKFKVYLVGTELHPTKFLTPSGELTPLLQEGMYHMDREGAERKIREYDDPDILRVFEATLAFEDL